MLDGSTDDGDLSARRVTRSDADLAIVQGGLERAPAYFLAVDGAPARPGAARRLRDARPEGLPAENKHTLIFTRGGDAVGSVDVLVGHPGPRTAFVSLRVIDEERGGRGLGGRGFRMVGCELRGHRPALRRIRLAVVEGQDGAMTFWRKMGFVATGETSVYQDGDEETTLVMFEKALAPPRPGTVE